MLHYLINEHDGIRKNGENILNYEKWWNKKEGGTFFELWKIEKVETLTINKIILFKTNLMWPNIPSIDD